MTKTGYWMNLMETASNVTTPEQYLNSELPMELVKLAAVRTASLQTR